MRRFPSHLCFWGVALLAVLLGPLIQRIFPQYPFDPFAMKVTVILRYLILGAAGFCLNRLGGARPFRPREGAPLSWVMALAALGILAVYLGGGYRLFPAILRQDEIFFGLTALYGGASLAAALFPKER